MANSKSAKKRVKQNEVRRQRNLSRRSAMKTAIKKINTAIVDGSKKDVLELLLKDATSQLARAKGKGLIHPNNASRKTSRLAKRVAKATASTPTVKK